LIFLSSAHGRDRPLCAIRVGATGDIRPTAGGAVAWYRQRDGLYMQTPIVYGDHLYACTDNGVLSCYKAGTGERLYRERLGRGNAGFTASAVAADGKLYFTNEDGDIFVVRAGPTFELLATNRKAEVCMATPAISDGMLIVRAKSRVYGIGQPSGRGVPSAGGSLHSTCPLGRRPAVCSGRLLRPILPLAGQRRRACWGHH
jgi:hypothetical protein